MFATSELLLDGCSESIVLNSGQISPAGQNAENLLTGAAEMPTKTKSCVDLEVMASASIAIAEYVGSPRFAMSSLGPTATAAIKAAMTADEVENCAVEALEGSSPTTVAPFRRKEGARQHESVWSASWAHVSHKLSKLTGIERVNLRRKAGSMQRRSRSTKTKSDPDQGVVVVVVRRTFDTALIMACNPAVPEVTLLKEKANTPERIAEKSVPLLKSAVLQVTANSRNSRMAASSSQLLVLRGGAGDEQLHYGGTGAGVTVAASGVGSMVVWGEEGSDLSDEACRALGVPKGTKWGVTRPPTTTGDAAGDVPTLVVCEQRFDVDADEEALLRSVFKSIDVNGDGKIKRSELEEALDANSNKELVEALMCDIKEDQEEGLDFEAFKKGCNQVLRVKGERVQWARSLGLDGLLARHLPLGTFSDQLSGIKSMSTEQLRKVVDRFMADVLVVLEEGVKELQLAVRVNQEQSKVLEHMNTKFAMDGAFVGKFATLDDFFKGPEALIGTPNPKIMDGMEVEHCLRGNCSVEFTTVNYNLTTTPKIEWAFVVNPEKDFKYPHTPSDKTKWPADCRWRGECGRDVMDLESFMTTVEHEIKQARLIKEEVIALRLYTGPMFVLYNAVLRGFPETYVRCLFDNAGRENRYETTIFAIASGITKLSKVTKLPQNRRLYRGLGGMILPKQFWEHYPECQITFIIVVSKAAAASVLANLTANINCAPVNEIGSAMYETQTDYLHLSLPSDTGSNQGKGSQETARFESRSFRVVKAPKHDGEVVRMSVALQSTKNTFHNKLEGCFVAAVRALCYNEYEVQIQEVADKPEDFRGGGVYIRA